MKRYPVYNARGEKIGEAETATQAGEMLGVNGLFWDESQKEIQVTLANVQGVLSWADSRLATASIVPLLNLVKK